MRLTMAMLALLCGIGPALALECPIDRAVYEDSKSGWQMRFKPVPEGEAANEIAYFTIDTKGTPAKLDGGVYLPNGYGQPMISIGDDCHGQASSCEFWSGALYALVDGQMVPFPYDADAPDVLAPEQLLLPEFAQNVWYSQYRQQAFDGDKEVGDSFTRIACAVH